MGSGSVHNAPMKNGCFIGIINVNIPQMGPNLTMELFVFPNPDVLEGWESRSPVVKSKDREQM